MAFEDILQKIREDGTEAVDAIKADTDAAVARITQQADTDAEALRNTLHQRAQRRATEHTDRTLTLAQLEHRKAVLAEKQRALALAFTQAEERLASLSGDEARTLLRRVISDHLETGQEEIVPGRLHAPVLDTAFVASLNESLESRGQLTLAAEPGDFDHGVVLREGRKEINLRLSVIMAETRERLVHPVAEHLFSADVT